jgi:ABC-type multidrug transport system ATPase subunit
MAPEPTITFENVHRRFAARPVLRGLDLRIRPGEIHALLGRNGSGKTTAMRILLGFLAPHAGRSTVRLSRLRERARLVPARSGGAAAAADPERGLAQ